MDSSSNFSFSLDLSSGSWDVSYDDDGELSPIYREDMSWDSILSQMETFERYEE